MPIHRSVKAPRTAPIEQAAWMLAAIASAVAIPALLQWIIRGIAEAGRWRGSYPVVATRMAVEATGEVVHWIGLAVLAGLAVACAAMAALYLKDARRRSAEVHPRAVAEAYALGALAAIAGLLWLV